jgi:hypothetical protein
MAPTLQVTVMGPHSLEAVTFGSQVGSVTGLQPRLIVPFPQVPPKEGGVTTFQVNVRLQVTVCPQAVASKVNTCVRLQPLMVMEPALQFTGTAPQELEAVTAPPKPPPAIPAQEGREAGLQPRLTVLLVQLAKTGVGFVGGDTVKVAWQVDVSGVQVLV